MIILILGLLLGAAASGQNIAFTHDGLDRQYRIHIPDDLPASAPLVVALHGYGGTNNGMKNNYGWVEMADERGFVVAFPNGTRDQWNSRFWDVGYDFHQGLNIDDDGFLRALTLHLQELHGLDVDRTFVTGFSNGADMCFQLACREPETFVAFAPIIGTMMDSLYTSCVPAINRSILAMNATDDSITLYEGDMDNSDGWGAYRSVPDVMTFWSDVLDVSDMDRTYLPDTSPDDGSTVQLDVCRSSDHELELRHYLILGGGHHWPGHSGNMDIDATLEAWNFFDTRSVGCIGSDINEDGLIDVSDVQLIVSDWSNSYGIWDLLAALEQWGSACSGACCLPSGTCQYINASECETIGGSWNGSRSSCTVENCQ